MPNTPKFTVAKYKHLETANGVAYTCDLLKDGKKVAKVSQEGNGGCNRYYFDDRAEETAYFEHAAEVTGETFEPQDLLTERLITVLEYSRMQSPPFVFEGDNPEMGEVRKVRGRATFDQVKELLVTRYADKKPRLFDKSTGEFVPVV